MITMYVRSGDTNAALNVFDKMTLRTSVTWNSILSGYCERPGQFEIETALNFFNKIPINDIASWNTMISGFAQNEKMHQARELFLAMPDRNSVQWSTMKLWNCFGWLRLRVLLHAPRLMKFGNVELAEKLFEAMLVKNLITWNAMIWGYVEICRAEDGLKLFKKLVEIEIDVVTWKAMISGYAQYGAGEKALSLLNEMKEEGTKSNWIPFVAVLSACNHAGLVDLGIRYFESMLTDYGVQAKADHYMSLLGACRIHKNLERAEYAAEDLLGLDPASAAGYFQLANAYAEVNRWDQVVSWIEIKSGVQEFRSGDRIHLKLAEIHEKLKDLERRMKLEGYMPELEFALHDVGEEKKEQLLLRHSEKLAIAFGLLRMPLGICCNQIMR
ncbi:DYW domain [Dillenia turbinata]|uniref:DYW domain n=1 Tax=Dillenia turbinata TaxID=194707 RepID=A0AAN8ZC59_9MAGN